MDTCFDRVSYRYGSVQALTEVSFTVPSGQTVALLGANGAGKSTAVDLLLGLKRPNTGTVTVLNGSPQDAVANGRVGAMLQSGGLPTDSTVKEVVDLACRLYGKRRTSKEVLDLAGLTELQRRKVDALSGGQAQRVRFAVAMAGRPELLFLDEPTVALDFKSRRQFWRAVKEEGNTVIFATHYLDEADEYADRVIVIDQGRVIADGSPKVIKGDTSLEHALVKLTEGAE
ncbi:ABC transporter ATP-binding protein [Kibdelosporangium aridum]|uniref:ABC-type multidrug transport system, ATPase component n=1 Tax=Kibdelosporangium aridum TaxID=2030 RepID=A0A1Y5XR98_KIBAR|nr:ABC transporter ATP-binding protein [Kibdelosporangium aridum]SMD13577.1 ABC-type multidrug transport system, ATPase component [Kibdelosporangium aridum]